MRIPWLPLVASLALVYGTVALAADSWRWGVAAAVSCLSMFLLAEWCVDAIVREIKRSRFRG